MSDMHPKSEQLQIRVTPNQKAALKRLARQAGEDVSSYVLSRVLPPQRSRFAELVNAVGNTENRRYALAEINEMLAQLAPTDFSAAVGTCDLRGLDPFAQNYLAAMVEHAAAQKNADAPSWVLDVPSLEEPWFATDLRSLRLHLLRAAPVAFKRRNLFVDSSVGDRV